MSRRQISFNVVALVATLLALIVRRELPAWWLVAGAANGNYAAVRATLDAGVPPDAWACGLGHMNALWFAAYKGDLPMARLLLARGADPTPAWKQAMLQGHPDLLALLLAAGARVSTREAELICRKAVETSDLKTLALLLEPGPGTRGGQEQGRLVNRHFDGGRTMLRYAAQARKMDACRYLIAHGADVDAADGQGRTALIQTLLGTPDGHNIAVADLLLAAGAQANVRDAFDKTALDYAQELGYRPLLDWLRRARSPVPGRATR